MNTKINKLYLTSFILTLVGLIFTILMAAFSPIDGENHILIEALILLSLLLSLALTFDDFLMKFKYGDLIKEIFSFGNILLSFAALLTLLASRTPYAIFYFCGDIMETGLSLFFILALFVLIATVVLNIVSYIFSLKNENEGEFDL